MNVPSINAQSSGAGEPAPAAGKAAARDAKKIEESAKQFEAMIVRQVLGDTFKPSPTAKGSAMPGSDIYQSFMTDTLADGISQSGSLGISHLLQSQLTPSKPAHVPGRKPSV